MNYNFNPQFPFAWSSGNPYIANGFAGASNNLTPAASQTPFSLTKAPPAAATQMAEGYNYSGIIGPGSVRFPTGVFPYGINSSFLTANNSFPPNWTFSFNSLQAHPDPRTHVQTQAPVHAVQTVQPVQQVPQNVCPVSSNIGSEINVGSGNVSDDFVEKVSTLLSDPQVLKSALPKLKTVPPTETFGTIDNGSKSSSIHLLSLGSAEQILKYASDTDASLELESETETETDTLVGDTTVTT